MLAIQPSKSQKCIPNLLPARLNHDGPVNDAGRYWQPEVDEKGASHSSALPYHLHLTAPAGKAHVYFRGRHLHGTSLPLPTNYTGAVLSITDKNLPQDRAREDQMDGEHHYDHDNDDEGDTLQLEIKVAEQVGEFDEVMVWGHGGEVDAGQDMVMRGVQEWIGFAESMHVDDDTKHEKTTT